VGRHLGLEGMAEQGMIDELLEDRGGEFRQQGPIAILINPHGIAGAEWPLPPAAERDHEGEPSASHGVRRLSHIPSGNPRRIALRRPDAAPSATESLDSGTGREPPLSDAPLLPLGADPPPRH